MSASPGHERVSIMADGRRSPLVTRRFWGFCDQIRDQAGGPSRSV